MTSPFIVGAKLAKWSSRSFGGASLSTVTVAKVRKDGKFFVQYAGGTVGEQMWKPIANRDGTWEARMTSKGNHYRESLEVWGPEHDAHLEAKRAERAFADIKGELLKRIDELSPRSAGDRVRLSALLGVMNRPVETE